MKRLTLLLLIVFLLAACGAPAAVPEPTAVLEPTVVPEPSTESFTNRIAEIDGLTVDDVQAIWRFDDSAPPDTPTRIVYREKDLKRLLEALQAVRLTGLVSPKASAVPGDWLKYRVYLLNGKTFDIGINSFSVNSQGKSCSYQNYASVQQVMGELERDPYLLGNDAYQTVEQVKITAATEEHIVSNRKQIEQYVRMFNWMNITGRSREPLNDELPTPSSTRTARKSH